MSNFESLIVIVASFFAGYIGYVYTWKFAHRVATEIATGAAAGSQISPEWRRDLLYGRYLYCLLSIVGWTLGIAAINVQVANLSVDPGVTIVAYVVVALHVFVAAGGAAFGSLELVRLRTILRQAEAD